MNEHKPLTFDEWVDYCFDRPVKKSGWWWYDNHPETGEELDWYWPDPLTITNQITRLFESPAFLIDRFSEAQIDTGLDFIIGIGSEYFWQVREPKVPNELQIQCIRSIASLYTNLFSTVCTTHLSYIDEKGSSPVNSIAYMLWDKDCIEGAAMFPFQGDQYHLIDPIFDVLQHALSIDHVACQESALHGLGHLWHWHQDRVQEIVGEFIETHQDIRTELMSYAISAMQGEVL